METILSGNLDEIFVGTNTGSLESLIVPHKRISHHPQALLACTTQILMTYLGRKLLVLVGDQVDTKRELVNTSTLASQVEDPDLRVGNTTVEA